MASHLFQVTFEASSGMPEDVVVNTFHFDLTGLTAGAVADNLRDFYEDTQTSGFAIADFFGQELTGDYVIKAYEDETAPPHIPIYTASYTLPSISALPSFPSEVAAVLSFKADPVAGVDIRSTRGRVYIGPLNIAAADGFVTGPPYDWNEPVRMRTGLRDTLVQAAAALMAQNDAGQTWGIWSRATSAFYEITNGFADNAFDTQRRRGEAASARSTF